MSVITIESTYSNTSTEIIKAAKSTNNEKIADFNSIFLTTSASQECVSQAARLYNVSLLPSYFSQCIDSTGKNVNNKIDQFELSLITFLQTSNTCDTTVRFYNKLQIL